MRIRACMVDSGDGEKTDAVYRFVKPRQLRGVYAYKGVAHAKAPISRASKANRDGVKVFSVNPNAFKDVLFARLKRLLPGPGYLHFGPEETGADENYFTQFGAEKRVVEWKANRPVVSYRNPGKKRNEAIDLYVLSLAALRSMGMHVAKGLGAAAEKLAASAPAPDAAAPSPAPATLPRPVAPRRAGGWVGGWKR